MVAGISPSGLNSVVHVMPRLALIALLALVLLAGCGLVGGEDEPVESDSALKDLSGLDELKARFNEDAGMIRILILLSPSCPECRLGASRVQQVVLDENPDADLRVYVVWADVIINDNRPSVDPSVIPDPRALHYWDREDEVGTWLAQQDRFWKLLRGPNAWDIYYIFGPDAAWDEAPGPLLDSGYPLVQKTEGLKETLRRILPR